MTAEEALGGSGNKQHQLDRFKTAEEFGGQQIVQRFVTAEDLLAKGVAQQQQQQGLRMNAEDPMSHYY